MKPWLITLIAGIVAGTATLPRLSQGADWAPTNIPDCVLWLDADDAGTITKAGAYVSGWEDKSPTGADVSQSSSTSRPQVSAGALGGRDILSFDGTDDWLGSTNSVLVSGDDDYTFVVVWRAHGTVGGRVVFEQAGVGETNIGHRAALLAVNDRYGFNGESNDAHDIAPLIANQWNLTTMVLDGTVWDNVYIFDDANDWLGGSINKDTQDVWTDGIRVGAKLATSAENLDGDIAEIIVYDRPLTRREINDVQHYLHMKWQLDLDTIASPPMQVEYDFEDGSLGTWFKVSGSTTNTQPSWSGRSNFAQSGKWFIGSAENERGGYDSWAGDSATGWWASPELVLTGNTVRAMVSGGNLSGSGWECQLLLKYENPPGFWNFARGETGAFQDEMREYVWPVDNLIGQNVRFEVIDNNIYDWGHINVDAIRITTEPRGDFNLKTTFNETRLKHPLFAYSPWNSPSVALTGAGRLRIDTSTDIPGAGYTYDLWSTVNHAPQLRLPVDASNTWFDVETHIVSRTFTNLENHSGLILNFEAPGAASWAPVMFGPYRDEGLWVQGPNETTGFGDHIPAMSNSVTDIYLRISRRENTYTFMYRESEGDAWSEAGQRTLTGNLLYVGLFAKAWDSSSTPVVEFDYLTYASKPAPTFFVVR